MCCTSVYVAYGTPDTTKEKKEIIFYVLFKIEQEKLNIESTQSSLQSINEIWFILHFINFFYLLNLEID